MNKASLFATLDRIDNLPTLPAVVLEVNQLLQDFETPIERVCRTIEKDQAMVPRILKLVNSAFFGLRCGVSTISHAVVLLGFNTIRNAVVAVGVIDSLGSRHQLAGFDITEFWTHSVAVAVTSRHLAERSHLHYAGDAFTAGLLHDMGKLVLFRYFRPLFERVWQSSQNRKASFYDVEREQLPVTHADIGAYLVERWQLPDRLTDAIRYHHFIREQAADLNLLLIVHAADVIVNQFADPGDGGPADFPRLHPNAAHRLRGCLENLTDWYPETEDEIQSACQFFFAG